MVSMSRSKNLISRPFASVMVTFVVAASFATATASENKETQHSDLVTTFWTLPKDGGAVILLAATRPNPLTAPVSADTVFQGRCVHCQMAMQCKSGEMAKHCGVCGCGATYVSCFSGKSTRHNSWDEMLQALPPGTALRVEFMQADKPESGLKRLSVDRRTALLPVEGLAGADNAQLLALAKPLGATEVKLEGDGKQLQIALKADWTADKEARMDKALATLNAKIAFSALPAPAQ